MLSDEVRARIAQLRLPPVASNGTTPAAKPLALRITPPAAPVAPRTIEGGQLCENGSGAHLRFVQPLAEWWPEAERIAAPCAGLRADGPHDIPHPELAATAAHFPKRTVFLDLETCGFAGAPVFLAGVVWQRDGVLVLDQLFARTYAEERALLETLQSIVGMQAVLATFNGKSFDWPMVRDRSTRHRLPQPAIHSPSRRKRDRHRPPTAGTLIHCDLLHHARRRWKRVLPDCRLQTLERFVCRRTRVDDLPGADVPAAYHHYVRTGRTDAIGSILHHNALDLVTLVQLTIKLIDSTGHRRQRLAEAS